MPRSALVVIDVQRGLVEGFEEDWAEALPAIERVLASARSANAPVVWVQHCGAGAEHPLHRAAPGWELLPILVTRPDDLRVEKTWSDAFRDTDLHDLLQHAGVRRLVLVGAQTEFCVDTTARRAVSLGYDVDLVADGHTTSDNDVLNRAQIVAHTNTTLANLAVVGSAIRVIPAEDIRYEEDVVTM